VGSEDLLPYRITVVIPTYNRAEYLDECLASVLKQTVTPYEVIVVDDGSTDSTSDVVAGHGDLVRYIRKENGGKPSALNVALPLIRGDFVWMFDDDDVAICDAIECRLARLEREPKIGFVLSGHFWGEDGPDGRIRQRSEHRLPEILPAELRLALMEGCFATMQSMLVRADVLSRAGRFDDELLTSEDYDMMLRLAAIAPFALVKRPTFIFRQHEGARGPRNAQFSAARRQQVFRKYDAIVGRKLRSNQPLGAYLIPPMAGDPPDAQKQVIALSARMRVMASKGLITELFDDLSIALAIGGPARIGLRSITAGVRDCVCTGYAYYAIAGDFQTTLRCLNAIARQPGGRSAIWYFSSGLLRLAKSFPGSLPERLHKLFLAVRALRALILPEKGHGPLQRIDN
jgi:GT2 family glycosyltransferase